MVDAAVRHVQEEANNPRAFPESVPDFPAAITCGKFAKPGRSLYTKGAPLSHSTVPNATLRLSRDDLLLIPERDSLLHVGTLRQHL